jgi:hypothetical protein
MVSLEFVIDFDPSGCTVAQAQTEMSIRSILWVGVKAAGVHGGKPCLLHVPIV